MRVSWIGTLVTVLASVSALEVSPRIIGGSTANEEDFPYFARIFGNYGILFGHICGATIISNTWVLTAAHCFDAKPETLRVLVSGNVTHTISRTIIHPDYKHEKKVIHDIALMKVDPPIVFTGTAKTIVLPAAGYVPPVGTELVTSGWGDTGPPTYNIPRTAEKLPIGKSISTVLKSIVVLVLEKQQCNISELPDVTVSEDMICTTTGVCNGDSGGPLVQNVSGVPQLVGVTSSASPRCWTGDSFPNSYMAVGRYVEWISQEMKNSGLLKTSGTFVLLTGFLFHIITVLNVF